MDYDEFTRAGFSRYERFARTVARVLQAAIDSEPRDFRLQQVKFRAKDAKSLRRKLTERRLLESKAIEDDLKDLAGCRLIFYTNADVDRFLNSRLIFENFVVDFDGSKVHHAVGTERSADELYFAIHYLVSLKEDRLSLAEYAQFRGMRCEVQLQTILNHAWAETSHDILYHPPNIQGFGTRQFEQIKGRLAKIMNKYLLPAGYEFQKVQHDYERLLAGKELFDRGTLEALGGAEDNNERYEQLQRVRKDLLPFYDDVPAVAPDVIRVAADTLKSARGAPTAPIETPFGNFDGHGAEDVANQALQIIDDLQYVDVAQTFRILCELYMTASSDEERKRILQSLEALARNDINVWGQVGFGVQKILCDAIRALPEQERAALHAVIVTLCNLFLDTELQGTTWHFDSVSLQRGAVRASTSYGEFRRDVRGLLFEMYGQAAWPGEKLQIIQALDTATQFPMHEARDDLIELVLDDTRAIVEFFSGRVDGEPFEIVQHLEHKFLYLYRRSKGMVDGWAETVGAKSRALVAVIETCRDQVNSNLRFVQFKTLVGFESVFPQEWDGDPMDIEGPQAYRAARITEYARSVSPENADEWSAIIKLCAAVRSHDAATFPSFGEFLKQLAARSPDIMIGYLQKDEEALSNFLPGILAGLAESPRPEAAQSLMESWIDQDRNLAALAQYLHFAESTPADLVAKVGHKTIEVRDRMAAMGILGAIIARQLLSLVDGTFLPVLRMLTGSADDRWVNGVWYLKTLRSFLESLSEEQSEVLLENMVLRSRIGVHDEWVLRVIAGKFPALIWRFFKNRMDRKKAGEVVDGYQPIPFDMRELAPPLAREPKLAVQSVRSWYSNGDRLFTYSGGRLLHNVFPTFTEGSEAELLALVRSGNDADINFVLSVLRSYQGGSFLHAVCRELVEAVPQDDNRLAEIEVILESTGTVAGEFGLVQAYQAKKEEVQSWFSDPRPKVRAFAERYSLTLDRSIAAEQRRSEGDYEMRRREWTEKH